MLACSLVALALEDSVIEALSSSSSKSESNADACLGKSFECRRMRRARLEAESLALLRILSEAVAFCRLRSLTSLPLLEGGFDGLLLGKTAPK